MRAASAHLAILLGALVAVPARAADVPPPAPALVTVAEALAERLGPPEGDRRSVGLALSPGVEGLRAPLETAVAGALARRGWTVATLPARGDAEREARARGLDLLLRVRGGVVAGGRELALVGEAIPIWPSFFLQRRPGVRPAPPRLVQARAAADPETLLLARPSRPLDPARVSLRPLGKVTGRVLALAAGEVAAGLPGVVAVTEDAVIVLAAGGEPIASLGVDPAARRPVRAPAATALVGELGGLGDGQPAAGRIAVAFAGAAGAEVLALRGDRLEPVASLPDVPLGMAGAEGLHGRFVPGTSMLADPLVPLPDAGAAPASPRRLVGVAAAPGGGPIAFGVLDARFRLALLDAALAPAAPAVDGVGAGFALADLDGDGAAEVVASEAVARGVDRVRVLAPRAGRSPRWRSEPLPGLVLAGAAFDLTGDGADDAVLALVPATGDGAETTLLLLTADPREAP